MNSRRLESCCCLTAVAAAAAVVVEVEEWGEEEEAADAADLLDPKELSSAFILRMNSLWMKKY